MALNGVFSNELQFASTCEQTVTDEREKDDASNADLEEGEIEDDEEEQPVEEKPSVTNKSENEAANIKDAARPAADDKKPEEKQREKRPANNSSSSSNMTRSKRRADSHERDSHRKRRRASEENAEQRGGSPPRQHQRESGSDLDENIASSSPRRGGRNAHDRRSRSGRGSPSRRRNDRAASRERNRRRDRSERDRRPAKSSGPPASRVKDESICAFFMEGKCSRGSDCPYSHAALPPRKMELCKFYLMDCCAKKEKCLYLHKDFPCKFFHTGRKCRSTAESCKFSHDTLSETMRAILIKHIETAPREILGDFPRLTREETIQAIDNFSNPGGPPEKRPGLPALFDSASSKVLAQDTGRDLKDSADNQSSPRTSNRPSFYEEVKIGHGAEEARDGKSNEENSRSIWFGALRNDLASDVKSENLAESAKSESIRSPPRYDEDFRQPPMHNLPARQRMLYRRIQQQQRDPVSGGQDASLIKEERAGNETWYSSEEEEDKSVTSLARSIHGDVGARRDVSGSSFADSAQDVNAVDVAKALSNYQTLQRPSDIASSTNETTKRDPRTRDPRKRSTDPSASDIDLRTFAPVSSRHDVDLRFENKMDCDFRNPYTSRIDEMARLDVRGKESAIQRHVFQEIDASTTSNPPIRYHLYPADVRPVEYGVIKVQADWAHLDPRQQKNWALNRNTSTIDSTLYSPASPEPPSGPTAPLVNRPYDDYPVATHGDPRQRDPRAMLVENRGPPAYPILPQHHAAEPDPYNAPYMHHHRGFPPEQDVSRELHRPMENRRDPRQRFRNQT